VVYVNFLANGAGTGTSWHDAFTTVNSALSAAQPGDSIWVAWGTYKPAGPGGDRAASFFLKTGVSLYGGFIGNETQLSQRDWEANVTVLSGDLNGDDGPEFQNMGDNAYHVVVALNVDSTAIIDGFMIKRGRADGPGFGATPASQDQGAG
jgi:hypothetical protein